MKPPKAPLETRPLFIRGLVTGLVGAAAVAVWFMLLDLIAGYPFRTPAALGSALLFGASGERMVPGPGVVAVYTVVHVAAFAISGLIFVAIAEQFARWSPVLPLTIPFAIVLEAVVVAAMALGARWVLGAVGFWTVLVGNVLAVASMGWYVWRTDPALRHRVQGP